MNRGRRVVDPVPAIAAAAGPFRVQPLALEGGGFSAPPSPGRPGSFEAPLSESAQALAIRVHEYGHLVLWRWGALPKTKPENLHDLWWQATLDVVVNAFMMAQGCHEIAALPLCDSQEIGDLPGYLAAAMWLRAEGLSCAAELRPRLARCGKLRQSDLRFLDAQAKNLAAHGSAIAERIQCGKQRLR